MPDNVTDEFIASVQRDVDRWRLAAEGLERVGGHQTALRIREWIAEAEHLIASLEALKK